MKSKLDLKPFIRNDNELFINKEAWRKINVDYSKLYEQLHPGPLFGTNLNESEIEDLKKQLRDEKTRLKEAISDAIEGLPLPLLPITEEDAKEDFNNLVKFNSRTLLRKNTLHTKAEYKYDLSDWYLSNSNVGRNSSNYFHQEARFAAKHVRFDSPFDSWNTKKIHQEFLEPLWTMKMDHINWHTLRECIVLRKYLASQFPPAVAKELYNLFEAKHILDFLWDGEIVWQDFMHQMQKLIMEQIQI